MSLISKNDKVAFIAPSSAINEIELTEAVKWFEKRGIKAENMPHVFSRCRYMAGNADERAADINACFIREDIKAVFCVRGGAGSLDVLDKIDYSVVRKMPKPVFGLSDSTALQNALYAKAGNVSYTGFLPAYDFKEKTLDVQLEKSLMGIFNDERQCVYGGQCLKNGAAEGVMVGGCLSVFCSLCGTPYFPDLKDKILLLEDVGEKTYKIERMLKQISMQPGFAELNGIVFGQFVNCAEADAGDGTVDEILQDFTADIKVPMVANFPYGHQQSRFVLPIGKKVWLNAGECMLKY